MQDSLKDLRLAPTITLTAWRIADDHRPTFDARSEYVERFWLPILGPSTVFFLRRVAQLVDGAPAGRAVDVHSLARSLGLGERSGKTGPLFRTLGRAIDFSMARADGPGRLAVRTRLPRLAPHQLRRLPDELRSSHEVERAPAAQADLTIEHAHRLALSLVRLGEAPDEVERQLLRWRFDAALAARAAQWAALKRTRADDVVAVESGHGAAGAPGALVARSVRGDDARRRLAPHGAVAPVVGVE